MTSRPIGVWPLPVEPPPARDPLLQVDGLSVDFGTEDGLVRAVRDVSFRLYPGEVLGVVGESGCGKSVSASALMGLLPRTARVTGSIRFAGRELVGCPDEELRELRGNRIGMIFQDPMTSLNPVYTVGWQLAEAFRAHHSGASRKRARAKAVEALEQVGIPQPDRRAGQYPHEFSGGMRQRVMIAMAIINEPALIIADEPTTALDVTVQAQILETLRSAASSTGAAVMLITHDLGVVAGMADRVQVMYGGTVVETAETVRLFGAPRMPYTVGLLGSVPNASQVGRALTPIPGAPPSPLNLPPGCSFGPRCPLVEPACRELEPRPVVVDEPGHESRCLRWQELTGEAVLFEVSGRPAGPSEDPVGHGARDAVAAPDAAPDAGDAAVAAPDAAVSSADAAVVAGDAAVAAPDVATEQYARRGKDVDDDS